MKIVYVICTALLFVPNIQCRGVNGGISCAVCTVIMGIVTQVAEIHEESMINATIRLCGYLPKFAQIECLDIVGKLQQITEDISSRMTPDVFCFVYGTCKVDLGQPLCHLFPLPFAQHKMLKFMKQVKEQKGSIDMEINVCDLPVIKDICSILNNSYQSLNAAQDFDNDGFSVISTARGSDWKGRDCRDNDLNAYPGRKPITSDIRYDSNCNGIWGMNYDTFLPWEKELCADSEPRGLIFIGDSIGAHFHLPQVWINPVAFDWPSFNASNVILDELDWPQYGFATGFKQIEPNILIKGFTDSIYLRLRGRNRCNHRDYQNLSQNGASSYEGIDHVNALSRNQTIDKPAIVIYAMQGNDVCNNFKDTLNKMTTPEIFRRNVMDTLNILNKKLPKKSHVLLMGLVNADFIYDAMAKRLHPIGYLHKNVLYEDVYNWFNCLQIGPCTGWLNSDETLRKLTTKRSKELTNVLKNIVESEKFEYFDLHFITNPINVAINTNKINIPDFLESADSLHPNQRAQPIMAETMWLSMMNDLPADVLGPVNKNNDLIKKLFGNQGGH